MVIYTAKAKKEFVSYFYLIFALLISHSIVPDTSNQSLSKNIFLHLDISNIPI
jgi:hypothetical protein